MPSADSGDLPSEVSSDSRNIPSESSSNTRSETSSSTFLDLEYSDFLGSNLERSEKNILNLKCMKVYLYKINIRMHKIEKQ